MLSHLGHSLGCRHCAPCFIQKHASLSNPGQLQEQGGVPVEKAWVTAAPLSVFLPWAVPATYVE